MSSAFTAFEDPFQHAAVLAVPRPEEFSLVVGAEPVYVKDLGQLGAGLGADLQIVREVIAHVVAAEGKHRHRVAAKLADLARRSRGGFAAGGWPQKHSL